MLHANYYIEPDNSVFWIVKDINVKYGWDDVVGSGFSDSEVQAQAEVRNAVETYFEENPEAREKYSKNLEQLFPPLDESLE